MKTKKSTDLVTAKKNGVMRKVLAGTVSVVDPQALLSQAIAQGLPEVSMERLFAMRREMEAERARKEYFKALAGFQHECPIIGKDRVAKIRSKKGDDSSFSYHYAPLETIIAAAQPVLERWGFSWTCKPTQTATHVKAAVHAHHTEGHEEVTEFEVPLDPASYMSEPQKAAAASTFARRYAFINAFGITTKGEDNDAPEDESRQHRREAIRPVQEKEAAVPVAHEIKRSDYEEILFLLKSTSTDPKTKAVVKLFSENEVIDYTHQATDAKDRPDELKVILKDVAETGKKRHRAVKGEA